MNQVICIIGVEGAEMAFFEVGLIPFIFRLYPIILSEWNSIPASKPQNVCACSSLSQYLNQRSRRDFFDHPRAACSRFRGDAELGCLGSPTKRPRVCSSRCASEHTFSSEQVHNPYFEFGSGMNAGTLTPTQYT